MSSFILWNFLPFLWEAEPQTAVQVQLPCSHFFEAHSYESSMTPQAVCWFLGMQNGTDTVRTASSAKYEGREDAECPGTHCLCKPWALCSHKLLGKLSVGPKKGVTMGFWLFCAEGTWLRVLKISWVLAFWKFVQQERNAKGRERAMRVWCQMGSTCRWHRSTPFHPSSAARHSTAQHLDPKSWCLGLALC